MHRIVLPKSTTQNANTRSHDFERHRQGPAASRRRDQGVHPIPAPATSSLKTLVRAPHPEDGRPTLLMGIRETLPREVMCTYILGSHEHSSGTPVGSDGYIAVPSAGDKKLCYLRPYRSRLCFVWNGEYRNQFDEYHGPENKVQSCRKEEEDRDLLTSVTKGVNFLRSQCTWPGLTPSSSSQTDQNE